MKSMIILIFCLQVLLLVACSRANDSTGATPHPKVMESGSKNSVIDFRIPAPLQPQTDVGLFDESFIFSPNFTLSQNDPVFSDLLAANGTSSLCFPTAFAEELVYLFGYHLPALSQLNLAGLAADRLSIDPNELIRNLANICHTDRNLGTDGLDAIKCMLSVFNESGYSDLNTQMISPFYPTTTLGSLPVQNRDVSIVDIRDALKTGYPLVMEVAWFAFDPASKSWKRHGGHYFTVFGFDYDNSWGDSEIQLKITNPEDQPGQSHKGRPFFTTVTVQRYAPQPGVVYPAHRPYILSGGGFGGETSRAYLGEILFVSPSGVR